VLEDGRSEDKEKIYTSDARKFPTIQLYCNGCIYDTDISGDIIKLPNLSYHN